MKDLTNREKYYHQILMTFHWSTLDSNEVFKHLGNNSLYTKSEYCLYQILQCLVQNNWNLTNYKSVYDELHNKFEQANHFLIKCFIKLIRCFVCVGVASSRKKRKKRRNGSNN